MDNNTRLRIVACLAYPYDDFLVVRVMKSRSIYSEPEVEHLFKAPYTNKKAVKALIKGYSKLALMTINKIVETKRNGIIARNLINDVIEKEDYKVRSINSGKDNL